jgi:protein-S-isoprenylcysteine O-methyltransferase Ste14
MTANRTTRPPSHVIRFLGVLVGLLFVVVGVLLIQEVEGGLRRSLTPLSMVVLGVCFLAFGLTGRTSVWGRRTSNERQ